MREYVQVFDGPGLVEITIKANKEKIMLAGVSVLQAKSKYILIRVGDVLWVLSRANYSVNVLRRECIQ